MSITTRLSDWYANLSPIGLRLFQLSMLLILTLVVVYWLWMPLKQVPLELPVADATPEAREASLSFWRTFHSGTEDPDEIDAAIAGLEAAMPGAENDETMLRLFAVAHLWRFHMRSVYDKPASDFVDDLVVTRDVGEQAIAIDTTVKSPMPSAVAMAEWQLGVIKGEDVTRSDVHFDVLDNTFVYPTFAAFIQGWMLSAMLDSDDPHFKESYLGYEYNMNVCVGIPQPPDLELNKFKQTFMSLKIRFLGDAICYNNPLAPHNIEGMFLSIGDAWLKKGDLHKARLAYENVKTSPTYADWRYIPLLEHRLANLETLSAKFNADSGKLDVTEPAMSFQSRYACAICHTE